MKKTLLTLAISALLAGCNTSDNDSQPPAPATQAYEYLVQLSSSAEGIGARPTGTEAETRAAAWIQDHLTGWGYDVQKQPFTYTKSGASKASQNLVAELKGQSDKVILIGAHYDSTGDKKGSEGATDNGAGVAALLAVAEALKGQTLPYTVRFAFFGAEENGLNGSKAYATSLDGDAVAKPRLAAVLPNPKKYSAANPGPYVRQRAAWIQRQARQLGGAAYLSEE